MRPDGSRKKLLKHFLANVGKVMDSEELREVAGVSEWGRRVRELRDEHGYQILTHSDRADLKPGQYLLAALEPKQAEERAISKETRAKVFDQYGSICYTCGVVAGELHPANGKPAVLQMGHILAKSHGGDDSISNLRPVCMVCNTGAANISAELPTEKRLIAELKRAPRSVQEAVHRWLRDKFKFDG